MHLDARGRAVNRAAAILTIATIAAAIFLSPGAVRAQAVPIEQAAQTGAIAAGALYEVSSGSYYLSRNIMVNGGSSNAINVTGPNVTIDFRGYSIIGKKSASGIGIYASGQAQVTIQNGNILGMAGGGVSVGSNSTVQSMHITGDGPGIVCGSSCLIQNNSVTNNTGDGISAAGLIRNNLSDSNTGNGITTNAITGTYSSITGNEVSGNTGVGIAMQSSDGYSNNVINNNATAVSGGVNLVGNVCNGSTTTCP